MAGALTGFSKGLIRQIASLVGLVGGLLVARSLFMAVGDRLAEQTDTSLVFARTLAFILIWMLVPLVFLLLASMCTNVADKLGLGLINRFLGAGLGVIKYILLVGMFIHLIEFIDSKNNLIKEAVKCSSVLYYPIKHFSDVFYPTIKKLTEQVIDRQ